jgi:CheY-like chemotaxis protein
VRRRSTISETSSIKNFDDVVKTLLPNFVTQGFDPRPVNHPEPPHYPKDHKKNSLKVCEEMASPSVKIGLLFVTSRSNSESTMSSTPPSPLPLSALPHAGAIRRGLVVDDSKLQRKLLSVALKKWGFEVKEAEGGEEALGLAAQNRPDLVLSDWMMPGMSGLELCQRFRELDGDEYTYFILLTSKSDKEEVARGLDSGADDFLSKPVDNNELRARITAGERLIEMQRNMVQANRALSETLGELQ